MSKSGYRFNELKLNLKLKPLKKKSLLEIK